MPRPVSVLLSLEHKEASRPCPPNPAPPVCSCCTCPRPSHPPLLPIGCSRTAADNSFLLFDYNSWGVSVMEDEGRQGDHLSGVAATDGRWHHIAVTWRSSDGLTKLYDNGREAWSVLRGKGRRIPSGGTLVVGREQDCQGGCFDSDPGRCRGGGAGKSREPRPSQQQTRKVFIWAPILMELQGLWATSLRNGGRNMAARTSSVCSSGGCIKNKTGACNKSNKMPPRPRLAGLIDEMRLWSTARSQQQVRAGRRHSHPPCVRRRSDKLHTAHLPHPHCPADPGGHASSPAEQGHDRGAVQWHGD